MSDSDRNHTVSIDDLGPTQREVVQGLLEHGPITARDLAERIDLRQHHIESAIRKLDRQNLVIREETDCPYGTGAYRLTERVQEVGRDE